MSKSDTSNLKFFLGLAVGVGLISSLSPTARQLIRDRLLEAVDNSKPHLADAMDALVKVLDEAKTAVIKAEGDLLGGQQRTRVEEDDSPDYIV